ncbi:flagella basal body P-ring formation protein FlgA [bacterium]|nr:flagella basal body P-ring formation protein FlgA [bacterium]
MGAQELSLDQRALQALQPPAQVRLTATNRPAPDSLPREPLLWRHQILSNWDSPSPRVRLEVCGSDGRRSWVVAFRRQVSAQQWHARTPLVAGTTPRIEDFECKQSWVETAVPPSLVFDWSQSGQYRLRRNLAQDAVLDLRQLERIPVCEAGCNIVVEHRQQGLLVRMQARAMEKGFAGQDLRVRLDSGAQMLVHCDQNGLFCSKTPGGTQP